MSNPLRLYEVYNTSSRKLLVLATDTNRAFEIAYAANHIRRMLDRKDKSYPHAHEVKEAADDPRFERCNDQIRFAIAKRLEGAVRLNGDRLYVGHHAVSVED